LKTVAILSVVEGWSVIYLLPRALARGKLYKKHLALATLLLFKCG